MRKHRPLLSEQQMMYSLSSRWEGSHTTSTMTRQRASLKASASLKSGSKPKPGRAAQHVTKASVAMSRKFRTLDPVYREASTRGGVRIRHKEFLWDIHGSTEFEWDQFALNPGIQETFPWLSAIANRFESYRFHALRFCYEPAVSTTTPGTAMLVVDYDASDAGPDTKTVALSYESSVRSAPWDSCEFIARTEDLHKAKSNFVRAGSVPNTDIKLYDIGNLFVATQGQLTTAEIGELYVEYDVELMTPQMNNSAPSLDLLNSTGAGVATNAMLGTPASVAVASDGITSNIPYVQNDAATLTLEQAGTYLLETIASAATSVFFSNVLVTGANTVKLISSLVGPLGPTSFANYVFKANRGDFVRMTGTVVGAPSMARWRLTQVAAAA